MAAKTASLSVNIIGDASKAKAAFMEAEKAAGSLSNQMKSVGKAIGAAFVGQEMINFAKGSIKAASDLGESMNAVRVVFGEAANGILKFGETASKTVGMSQSQFNSFAVSFAGFTQKIAGATGDVSKVTADLTTRIADFASVMNLDIKEAAQVFQSSLAGQTEPIRRFGIDLSAAAVETFALSNGLASSKAEMTEAIKVQARYGLLMQETAKTTGDFANTSDSLANRQRILAASFEDMKAKVGEALVPAMESLLGVVGPVISGFNSMPPALRQVISTISISTAITRSFGTVLTNIGVTSKSVHNSLNLLNLAFVAYNLNQQRSAQEQARFNTRLSEWAKASDEQIEKQFALAYSAMVFTDQATSGADALRVFARESLVQTERLVKLGIAQKVFGISTEEAIAVINEEAESFKQLNRDAETNQKIIEGTVKVSGALIDVSKNVDGLENSWGKVKNTLSDGRFVSKAIIDVWRDGYTDLKNAGQASQDFNDIWVDGYETIVEGTRVSEDLIGTWQRGYYWLQNGREASDFLINAWRDGYKELRNADSVTVDLANSWKNGYRAMINGRDAADELSSSINILGAQANNARTLVSGLTDEWEFFLDLLDKKDAFISAQESIDDYKETFKKAANGNKEAQEEVNEKLRQGQREIIRAMELADLIPKEQSKKILFLTETGELQKALDLLKLVDSWYMTVQQRAAITSSGMGSGRLPGMAAGGTVTQGGFVVVGEQGPELLHLPGGASVSPSIPNEIFMTPQIESFGASGGGGQTVVVNVSAGLVSSPDQVGAQIIDAIRRAERRSGQVFVSA